MQARAPTTEPGVAEAPCGKRLDAFEREYAITSTAGRGFREALAAFAALWAEASALNEGFPGDGRADVEADVELARVLNGLPRRP